MNTVESNTRLSNKGRFNWNKEIKYSDDDNIIDEDLMDYAMDGIEIKCIDLSYTDITDLGIESLVRIKGIERVVLSGCESITSVGFRMLSQITELTHLSLLGCFIENDDLKFIGDLPNLTHLDLSWCGETLTQECLIHLENTNLVYLNVSWCAAPIADLALDYISYIEGLETLIICGGCNITDNGLLHLTRLENLRRIKVGYVGLVTDDGIEAMLKSFDHNVSLSYSFNNK